MAVAVLGGCVAEVAGDAHEALTDEEDAEGRGQEREGEPLHGIEEVEATDGLNVGDEGDLDGEQQGPDDDHEEQLAQRELEEREGVGGQDRGDELRRHDDHGDDQREAHGPPEVGLGEGPGPHVPLRVDRVERLALGDVGERVGQRPQQQHVHGEQDQDREGPEEQVPADGPDPAPSNSRIPGTVGGRRGGGVGSGRGAGEGRVGHVGRRVSRHSGPVETGGSTGLRPRRR